MFSNSKNTNDETGSRQASSKRNGRAATSILSAGLQIAGQLRCEGDIQIDAEIQGDVESDMVTVGKSGVINGYVTADEVTISGRIVGDIRARNVKIMGTAHVEGDIHHSALSVEPGAYVDGVCRRVENPHTSVASKSKKSRSSQPKLAETQKSASLNGSQLAVAEGEPERVGA